MVTINLSPLTMKMHATTIRSQYSYVRMPKFPRKLERPLIPLTCRKYLHLRCSKSISWETSQPFSTSEDSNDIIQGSNIVEPIATEDSPELPIFHSEQTVVEMGNQPTLEKQTLKWPLWLLGPTAVLATGVVPTLWLPLSSVFLGSNVAGLLSLLGLDCIFNMGATLFLLMADACGRSTRRSNSFGSESQVPNGYRLWNIGANLVGFIVPLMLLFATQRGCLRPEIPFISYAVLLGPYLLLVAVQMLTEMLTWHWRSPVWLVVPIVYEVYRVLQLMRGLKLSAEVGAPSWMIESIRGLVSWWVLILGIQLMRVAWFSGTVVQRQSDT